MIVTPTRLPGVLLVEPRAFADARGYFLEAFHAARYEAAGIAGPFVQDNVSRSRRGVLRGLHFQHPFGQRKLVSVLQGEVFDVAVDVRLGSPTFARWTGHVLSAENGRQLYIPEGFAHGFLTLSEEAVFAYKCSEYYRPEAEHVVRWDDGELGIAWPGLPSSISPRDGEAASLAELPRTGLPRAAALRATHAAAAAATSYTPAQTLHRGERS